VNSTAPTTIRGKNGEICASTAKGCHSPSDQIREALIESRLDLPDLPPRDPPRDAKTVWLHPD